MLGFNLKNRWLSCCLLWPAYALASTGTVSEVDAIVARVMQTWNVPGVAVGIIEDGKVKLAKGYGWRDIEAKKPMTEKTVLGIGSNSKSFNAVLTAMLVDDKKLKWDQPVQEVLPGFKLKDAYASQNITIRDLHIHNSGLPQDDAAWYMEDLNGQELLRRLPYFEPTVSFRQSFQYQNAMYVTASLVQEKVTAQQWDALIKQRLFKPLGMNSSSATLEDGVSRNPQGAKIYEVQEGKLKPIPYKNIDNVKGAGSINSTVEDMLKYLYFRLGLTGKELLSSAQFSELTRPQFLIDDERLASATSLARPDRMAYASGLMHENHGGSTVLWHTGGIDGFTSAMAWIPEKKWAVVVLTNSESRASSVIFKTLVDQAVGVKGKDRIAKQLADLQEAESKAQQQKLEFFKTRVVNTRPSRVLSEFAGHYQHPFYGDVEIKVNRDRLLVRWGDYEWPLTHFHYDVFYAAEDAKQGLRGSSMLWSDQPLGFVTDATGKVAALEMTGKGWRVPQRFARQEPLTVGTK